MESFGQTFTHLQGLGGVFQHHGIPRDQRWRDRVDRRHIGVVPRGHDQYNAARLAGDLAGGLVAVFDNRRGQRLFGDVGHIVAALGKAAKLAAIAHGTAHLMRQFLCHTIGGFAHLGNGIAHQLDTFGQGARGPCALCCLGAGADIACRLQRQDRAFKVNRSVNR